MGTRPFLTILTGMILLVTPMYANASQDLVLIEVNGEAITSADLERMIVESHATGMSSDRAEGLVPLLLQKAVRDRLILQDAFAMGMGDDPAIAGPIEEEATRKAISLYSRSQVELPTVSDEEIRQYYEDYYHRVQLRQISFASAEECRSAIRQIESGEVTMGELATRVSLDGLKSRGGLNKDLYWADLDFTLRDACEFLEVGAYSEPFEFNGNWAFVRVESRTPVDDAGFADRSEAIRLTIRNYKYEQVWKEFVTGRMASVEVQVNQELLAGIREDEAMLYRGEFKLGSEAPFLVIDPGHYITDRRFREAMSETAMEMGTSTFEAVLERALDEQKEVLVLALDAEQAGYFEDPEVVEYYQSRLESVVLNAYLKENIADRIVFNRDEYVAFYEEHADEFRGAEEVRMSIMTSDDEALIREAAQRLSEGADFDRVRADVEGRDEKVLAKSASWSPITVFNDDIVAAASGLEVGQTSAPVKFGRGWLIFRLDGRREGSVPPIEMVDSKIREALYYQEFSELLDEHLARLEEGAVIVRHEDRIRAWAQDES